MAALDRPRKHAPSKNVLATFSAVLRIGTGLGKIAIRVFKHFILVAVTQLVMKIRPGAAGAFGGFLFDRSLSDIAVRVFLFCHRAKGMRLLLAVLYGESPGAGVSPAPRTTLVIGPR